MTVGERIESERKKKHLSMEALGDMLGVGRSAVNKWEKGTVKSIKRETIMEMAKIFNCNPAWLGGYTEEVISFDTPEEFELAWHRSGGGRHPLQLSDLEHEMVLAYRATDNKTKENVLKLLDISIKEKNADAI